MQKYPQTGNPVVVRQVALIKPELYAHFRLNVTAEDYQKAGQTDSESPVAHLKQTQDAEENVKVELETNLVKPYRKTQHRIWSAHLGQRAGTMAELR